MALIKCPECSKEISTKASMCPYCGYKKKKQRTTSCSGIVLFIIVAFILLLIIDSVTGDKNNSKVKTHDFGSERLAYNLSKDYVKSRLKSPSTAKFPGLIESKNHVKGLGGGRYKISSWVDSQNSFGATVRSKYTCILKVSGNAYSLESINIE